MFKRFVRFVELSQKVPLILTLDGHYSHSRNIEVIGCARENAMHIFCLPPHSTHKLQPQDVSFLQLLRTLRTRDRNLAVKPSKHSWYTLHLLAWLGKLTWNRPQQLLLQTGSGKQACLPATVTCLMNLILEESQRNITSCLRNNTVPCTGTAEEPPTTSGTNPRTLTNSNSAWLIKHHCCPVSWY